MQFTITINRKSPLTYINFMKMHFSRQDSKRDSFPLDGVSNITFITFLKDIWCADSSNITNSGPKCLFYSTVGTTFICYLDGITYLLEKIAILLKHLKGIFIALSFFFFTISHKHMFYIFKTSSDWKQQHG